MWSRVLTIPAVSDRVLGSKVKVQRSFVCNRANRGSGVRAVAFILSG